MRISDWSSDVCSSDLTESNLRRYISKGSIRPSRATDFRTTFLKLGVSPRVGPSCRSLASRLKNCRLPTPNSAAAARSEEHTSELQSLMRISYAVFCLKKKRKTNAETKQYTRLIRRKH